MTFHRKASFTRFGVRYNFVCGCMHNTPLHQCTSVWDNIGVEAPNDPAGTLWEQNVIKHVLYMLTLSLLGEISLNQRVWIGPVKRETLKLVTQFHSVWSPWQEQLVAKLPTGLGRKQQPGKCPNQSCLTLSRDGVGQLFTWMHPYNRSEPELASRNALEIGAI